MRLAKTRPTNGCRPSTKCRAQASRRPVVGNWGSCGRNEKADAGRGGDGQIGRGHLVAGLLDVAAIEQMRGGDFARHFGQHGDHVFGRLGRPHRGCPIDKGFELGRRLGIVKIQGAGIQPADARGLHQLLGLFGRPFVGGGLPGEPQRVAEGFGKLGQFFFQFGGQQLGLFGRSLVVDFDRVGFDRRRAGLLLLGIERDAAAGFPDASGRDSAPARRLPAGRNSRAAKSGHNDGRDIGHSRPSDPTGPTTRF